MATIEPRLIHLLNESTTPQLSNNDLPPLHSLLLPEDSPDRPLPPLDLEGSHRIDRHHGRQAPPSTSGPPSGPTTSSTAAATVPHHPYPLRLLLGDGDVTVAVAAAAAAATASTTSTSTSTSALMTTTTATGTTADTASSSTAAITGATAPATTPATATAPAPATATGTAITAGGAGTGTGTGNGNGSGSGSGSGSGHGGTTTTTTTTTTVMSTELHHSFSNILDDGQDSPDDAYSNKKRARAINVKDDFVQLPQPVKKQKAAQQAPVMPPIINGLLEPPPHAALFPPMSSASFDDIDANQMKLLHDFNHGVSPEDKICQKARADSGHHHHHHHHHQHHHHHHHGGSGSGSGGGGGGGGGGGSRFRKRASKPRRKWSNEETDHLLLGVNRHGVGKWTNILEDPEFEFNGRTAGDLKDRFRTCCPEELRSNAGEPQREPRLGSIGNNINNNTSSSNSNNSSNSNKRAKKGIYFENILIDEDELSSVEPTASPHNNDSDSAPKKKSRAHRKKMEDLAQLGIHGPFKKSHRRERRPFTEQDDREILVGLDSYGPAWTKIQRDSRFHLSSRQPTDLRDRVRNKYPTIYQRIEKGTFQVVNESRSNALLEPSINMMIDGSFKAANAGLPMSQYASHGAPRDQELPRWPFSMLENLDSIIPPQQQQQQQQQQSQQPQSQSQSQQPAFDFAEPCAPTVTGGEMDISRLLLDDSRVTLESSCDPSRKR